MPHRSPSRIALDTGRGAFAGIVATWLMDQVTTGMAGRMSDADRARASAAMPNGRTSVENLLVKVEEHVGMTIDPRRRPMALRAIHLAFGVVPAAAYGALGRKPMIGVGRGLVFGLAVWAINDEYLNTALGLAGAAEAYPTEVHLRGLVGHAVLGCATDTAIAVLGG